MNVIIVGCGKVGYTLAETLSNEGHDITVVDSNPKAGGPCNSLDVQCVNGNGASYRVLAEAGVAQCDLVIAATSGDEVNMALLSDRSEGRPLPHHRPCAQPGLL